MRFKSDFTLETMVCYENERVIDRTLVVPMLLSAIPSFLQRLDTHHSDDKVESNTVTPAPNEAFSKLRMRILLIPLDYHRIPRRRCTEALWEVFWPVWTGYMCESAHQWNWAESDCERGWRDWEACFHCWRSRKNRYMLTVLLTLLFQAKFSNLLDQEALLFNAKMLCSRRELLLSRHSSPMLFSLKSRGNDFLRSPIFPSSSEEFVSLLIPSTFGVLIKRILRLCLF